MVISKSKWERTNSNTETHVLYPCFSHSKQSNKLTSAGWSANTRKRTLLLIDTAWPPSASRTVLLLLSGIPINGAVLTLVLAAWTYYCPLWVSHAHFIITHALIPEIVAGEWLVLDLLTTPGSILREAVCSLRTIEPGFKEQQAFTNWHDLIQRGVG